ncbi:hypothetical protein [Plantactinospora sonchi]|uniref:DUF222 domain-containing protein n=1 Tax=Plantactinospora sonchi TaxID=1544735 RepID=A0ABU7RM58_9ACTN
MPPPDDAAPAHPWQPRPAEIAAEAARTEAEARAARQRAEARRWGGRIPSERICSLPANARALARLDRDLIDALDASTPEQQRDIARWAARQACGLAGLDAFGVVAAALAAMDRGEPPPPPLGDTMRAWRHVSTDPHVPRTVVTTSDGTPNFSQQALALSALRAAVREDPLVAAVDALHAAAYTHGQDWARLVAQARATFAVLAGPT